MVNARRGEIEAVLDGKLHTLCLTLGSLAELEDAFKVSDLLTLAERFQTGHLSARDIAVLIACGLRGAGHELTFEDVLKMQSDNGIAGFAKIAQHLLSVTFGGGVTQGEEVLPNP